MKFVIALLVAAVSADAPPAYNEPPFAVATHPAAAGLIQLNAHNQRMLDIEMSEEPVEHNLFADGEKGDADMGLKIQMKGDRFDTYKQNLIQITDAHNQRLLEIEMSEEPAVAVVEDEAPAKKEAKVAVLAPEKVHTLDPKIAKSHTTFYNRQ